MEDKHKTLLLKVFKVLTHKEISEIEKSITSLYTEEEIPKVIYRLFDIKNQNFQKDELMKHILNIIDENMFDIPIYEKEKSEMTERDEFISNPFTVEEGVMQCNKCGSKKTYSQSKQVRSADEGFTTFCMCSNCGAIWRIN
jgi:DNA-directed RNA polymerase subunit M/transcription elongation factor TFIIS